MVRRSIIFVILISVFRTTVLADSSPTTVSTQQNTSPVVSRSCLDTDIPVVFPSNETDGKPIISLNKTVDTLNLTEFENIKSIKNGVIHSAETEEIKLKNSSVIKNVTHPISDFNRNETAEQYETITVASTESHNFSTQVIKNEVTETNISSTEKPVANSPKPIDTEVSDLLDIPKETHNNTNSEPVSPKKTQGSNEDVDLSILLFDKVLQTEDLLRNYSNQNQPENVGIIQGKLAAILAGVFVVICILGYAALLSWRRFLEHRYGNREMLVDEEDFYTEDLGHFSI